MLFEPFNRANSYSFSMTDRTLIEVFFHLFSNFLWLKADGIYPFSAITTIKRYISTLKIEVVFSFFSKRWNIDEVGVRSRHKESIEKIQFSANGLEKHSHNKYHNNKKNESNNTLHQFEGKCVLFCSIFFHND